MRSEYEYGIDGNILYITDLNGMKSVTNDIENVLADITPEVYQGKLIMYKDSQGIWDGIRYENNHIEFFSINETNFQNAKIKLSCSTTPTYK